MDLFDWLSALVSGSTAKRDIRALMDAAFDAAAA